MGYCPRKVYWNILHCKLWWISTNALTHVTCLCTGKQWLWCTSFWTIWLHKTSRCHCAIYLSFFPDNMVAQDIKTWLECIVTLHYSSFIPYNTIAHVQDIKVSPIALYLEPGKMPKCTSTCNAIHILCSAPPIPILISTKKVSGCHTPEWTLALWVNLCFLQKITRHNLSSRG